MKNSHRTALPQEYRILEYAGMSGAVLSVSCPNPRNEQTFSFFNLFPAPALFFSFDIFDAASDYRIAMHESLMNRIAITVSAVVRTFRKLKIPLRRFFRRTVRLRTVYLFHCILRL